VFEIVLRHLAGFLSAYQIRKDGVFLEKAAQIGEALLPLFKESGLFLTYASFLPRENGKTEVRSHGREEVLLSDIGSIQLEFYTLSMLTGDDRFARAAARIHKSMFEKYADTGLYPERISSDTWAPFRRTKSIDSMSDSFYEYLIKIWLLTNGSLPVMLERYLKATDDIESQLIRRMESRNWTFTISLHGEYPQNQMTHLATFAAGMLALGTVNRNPRAIEHLQLADDLIKTYVDLYRSQPTGLMPECVKFLETSMKPCADEYMLRPETVESLFVLYRFTGQEKYREWAWRIFQSIDRACKVEGGYAPVRNVRARIVKHLDVMDSYFLAETLKYLYLIFTSSEVLRLGEWVFNTEAHPLRVWTDDQAARMKSIIGL
jgi:mannosyl-oligosaccharide alpha-1,2-mannosidase